VNDFGLPIGSERKKGILMKLAHVVLITACIAGGYAQAQTTREEDKAVARACKADGEHLCAGKTGQAMTQCLKSNQDKLSSNCKDAMSKMPQPK
jgi:hypothetical protein